jgi:hypothetical protein
VVASTLDVAPWLMVVGRQKSLIFPAVGALLAFNYWLVVVRPRSVDCQPGDICHVDSPQSRFNRVMLWTSIGIYVVAIAVTYGATLWLRWQS